MMGIGLTLIIPFIRVTPKTVPFIRKTHNACWNIADDTLEKNNKTIKIWVRTKTSAMK